MLVVIGWPSAVYIASLSIKALLTLYSWNIFKLVSSAYNSCIVPFAGSTVLVMSLATENWLVSFTSVLELKTPEYIIVLPNCSWYLFSVAK